MNFQIPEFSQSQWIFTGGGLALLLFGWIIFKLGTRLFGIGLGGAVGFFLGEILNILLKIDRNTGLYVSIGCGIVGALAAMFFLRAVTNFLFAVIGFLVGALMGRIGAEIFSQMNHAEFGLNSQTGAIIIGLAIMMALLAVWMQRLIMIFATSYVGALFFVTSIDELAALPWSFPAVLVAGILWQWMILGRLLKRRKKPAEDSD